MSYTHFLAPLTICLFLQAPNDAPVVDEVARKPLRVLVYTHSAGFEHAVVKRPEPDVDSLVERTLRELAGRTPDLDAIVSRDASWFDPARLAELDAVLFFTTGELPLDERQRQGLLDFVHEGGAFVGVHSATDTFLEFEPYRAMLGGTFDGHPWHQRVRVLVEDREHPATRHLGAAFEIEDEIYQLKAPYDRDKVEVLLRLDVDGLDLERPGVHRKDQDFALAWGRAYGAGRVFYTALGHRAEVWADERFLRHLIGGLRWAARRVPPQDPTSRRLEPSAPVRIPE